LPEAKLNICPKCGKHGNISWRGGTGPEFGTKSHAAVVIKNGITYHTVTESEAERIFREIETSSLPTAAADADPLTLWKIEQFMTLVYGYFAANSAEENHPYGTCHDFLDRPSPAPMPANFLRVYEESLRHGVQQF
jgi:hypothetical protein